MGRSNEPPAPRSEIASEFLLFGALHVDVAVLPMGLGGSLCPGSEGWRIVGNVLAVVVAPLNGSFISWKSS